jgi:hypothetical protein
MGPVDAQRDPGKRRRRSRRLSLHVPVRVSGLDKDKNPFREEMPMLSVNAHGGLLALRAKVERGQRIFLVNTNTQEERECRVVYLGREFFGRRKVGIEFTNPASNFWRASFPPEVDELAETSKDI